MKFLNVEYAPAPESAVLGAMLNKAKVVHAGHHVLVVDRTTSEEAGQSFRRVYLGAEGPCAWHKAWVTSQQLKELEGSLKALKK